MATQPDLDIVNRLDSQVASLTKNTNLFRSKVRAISGQIPSVAAFCLASGGPPPQGYADGTAINRRYSGVQIRVVALANTDNNFKTGQDLAKECRDAVHHAALSGYIDVRVLETEPIYIGENNDRHHEWSINVELWHEQ